jgi:hypothetical protein
LRRTQGKKQGEETRGKKRGVEGVNKLSESARELEKRREEKGVRQ